MSPNNTLGRRRAVRGSPLGEDGFTLTEMIVTLLIVSIFVSMATVIMVKVLDQTAGQRATLRGLQEAQIAERTFTQYLRSADNIAWISPTGNDIVFTSNVGTTTSNGVISPAVQTIEAQLCPTSNPKVDALEILFGLPTGSTGIHECIGREDVAASTTTTSYPPSIRLVQAFDLVVPVSPVFTFYKLSTVQQSGGLNQPELSTIDLASAIASPSKIEAVGLNATFVPPPGPHIQGYGSELGTTIQAVAFLRNRE
ncbi:MAG: PulJ/GspJ family protein [Acidimicrobiales bacterium]